MNTDIKLLKKLSEIEKLLAQKWEMDELPKFTINLNDKELAVRWAKDE